MAQPPQQPPQPLPGQAAVVPAGPQLVVIPAIPAGGLPVIPPLPGDTVKTVGADKKPKFDRNAPVHRHDLSLCLTNMTQSEVTAHLTPYFVRLPDMRVLVAREPRMANALDGCFLMPRSGTAKVRGLPTLVQADAIVDPVFQAIRATPEWTAVSTALNELDSGMEWVSGEFTYKMGTNYNAMAPVNTVLATFANPNKANAYRTDLTEMNTDFRSAMSQGYPDKDGRDAWYNLIKMIGEIVQEHITQDQDDYDYGRQLRAQRAAAAARVTNQGLTPEEQIEAAEELDDLDTRIQREWPHLSRRINPNGNLYIDSALPIHLEAKSDSFRTYYCFITCDIHHEDVGKMHVQAHPTANGQYHQGQRNRFIYIANLLKYRDSWPFCQYFGGNYACKAPNKYHKTDVALVYHVNQNNFLGQMPWQVPMFLIEIKGKTESPQGRTGPFAQLAHQASSMMVYLPVAYGMIVRKQDVSLYEFSRNPSRSEIVAYETRYAFNGADSSIGNEMKTIADLILKCVLKSLIGNLSKCLPGLDHLYGQGFRPVPQVDVDADQICLGCWHIDSLYDLDWHMVNDPQI